MGRRGVRKAPRLLAVGAAVSQLSVASGLVEANVAWKAGGCDVVSSGPVCFNGGATVLLPGSSAPGLGGHWTFDEEGPVDASGNGNHGIGELQHAPSPIGSGYSALFARNFLMVPDSKDFHSEDFAYSFWVYVLDDPLGHAREAPHWCPLLRKGVYVTAAEEFANSPALLYSRNSGHLRASVTTSVNSRGDGEYVESNARLLPNRWIHVALVHHRAGAPAGPARLLIYVNGILDVSMETRGLVEQNTYPLYIGGDPFTSEECDHKVYLDEFRMYNRAVTPHEVQAEAAPALAGVDPSFVRLGCLSCSLEEAVRGCPATRHICTDVELHTGGYQVARALGWMVGGTQVWTHATVVKEQVMLQRAMDGQRDTPSSGSFASGANRRLALCCEGSMSLGL